jgi:hypothetical protein
VPFPSLEQDGDDLPKIDKPRLKPTIEAFDDLWTAPETSNDLASRQITQETNSSAALDTSLCAVAALLDFLDVTSAT